MKRSEISVTYPAVLDSAVLVVIDGGAPPVLRRKPKSENLRFESGKAEFETKLNVDKYHRQVREDQAYRRDPPDPKTDSYFTQHARYNYDKPR